MTITCSTKVCSFGKQVVEKVETEFPVYENGRYVYKIHRSAMCEYMINFIHKLKHLPEKFMMNSVLENFTILQVKSILVFWRIYFFCLKYWNVSYPGWFYFSSYSYFCIKILYPTTLFLQFYNLLTLSIIIAIDIISTEGFRS